LPEEDDGLLIVAAETVQAVGAGERLRDPMRRKVLQATGRVAPRAGSFEHAEVDIGGDDLKTTRELLS
jgi:hypothetical protein